MKIADTLAATGRSPQMPLPAHGCDCHVHVFDPLRFAYDSARRYTPPAATQAELHDFARTLGVARVVLVQPSVYGTDNRCLLDALRQWGSECARGVAVVDVSRLRASDIATLEKGGIRGIRLNLAVQGQYDATVARRQIRQALGVLSDCGWSLHIHADLILIDAIADILAQASVPVVLDHFARLRADLTVAQPGFATLLTLLTSRRVWAKLSAPYHTRSQSCPSSMATDVRRLMPFVQKMIAAAPERLLWGSDWPHTGGAVRNGVAGQIEPFRVVDDAATLDALYEWGGAALYRKILVENPARLYGFTT